MKDRREEASKGTLIAGHKMVISTLGVLLFVRRVLDVRKR